MTLALERGAADVLINSNESIRSCISAETQCLHGVDQANDSCPLQFAVGGKLEVWNTTVKAVQAGFQAGVQARGSKNIFLEDGAGNLLEEIVIVGTQFAVLTEGSGHTSYVMPARASRYLIAPWKGLTGREEAFKGQLNTLDLGKATCLIKA